jgi:hypothetical protein
MPPKGLILVVAPDLSAVTTFAGMLSELATYRGRVHIAVHDEPPPGADVTVFSGKFRRLSIGKAPTLNRWSALSSAVHGCLDCWQVLDEPSDDGEAFQRALAHAPPLAARLADARWLRVRGTRRLAAAALRVVDRALPCSAPIVDFLRHHNPELLVVTPLFGTGTVASDYVRAANQLGIPTIGFAVRWDDVTNGARVHAPPDCIALWNRDQRRQAVQRLGIPARHMVIVGAPLPLDIVGPITTTRDSFCQRHGLDATRAIVLLAPRAHSPAMPEWIRGCVDGLRSSSHPQTREANVLVYVAPRPGVQQVERPHVTAPIVPRPDADPTQYAFEIAEALHHADVVVSSDMELVLEAAARARPLIAVVNETTDPELARFATRIGPERGWPELVRDFDECAACVGRLLCGEARAVRQAQLLVRPHGPELPPGFLMRARLAQVVVDRGTRPRPVPRWTPWLRIALAPVARAAERKAAVLPVRRYRDDFARILVAVPSAAALFLYQPLLRVLLERGNQLRLIYPARRGRDEALYARIRFDLPGVVDEGVLAVPVGVWSRIAEGLLGLSMYVSLLGPSRVGAPSWLPRASADLVPRGARLFARVARQFVGLRGALSRTTARLHRAVPPSKAARELLARVRPDVVLALPDSDVATGLESAAAHADVIRAAAALDVPSISVAWAADAELQATLVQPGPSEVFVWNEEQRDRIVRQFGMSQQRVSVTGAPSLDRCLDRPPILEAQEFRSMLGLPDDGPFAFFAGSSGMLSEPKREVDHVRRWIAALRASDDAALRALPVLIRPPVGVARWRSLDLTGMSNVVICPRQYERSGELDLVLLAESVRYAAVTIGIDRLTLTIAAALGRPAVAIPSLGADGNDQAPLEYLWKTRGSAVTVAGTIDELNQQVRRALTTPASAHSREFIEGFVRPRADVPASVLAAERIDRMTRGSYRRARSSTGAGAVALRAPLLVLAAAVGLMGATAPLLVLAAAVGLMGGIGRRTGAEMSRTPPEHDRATRREGQPL